MKTKHLSSILFCALGILVSATALSHGGATGIVKERMDAMSDMSDQSKAIGKMFKGESDLNVEQILSTAELFIVHGNQMISLFPDTQQSRNGKKTEALPAIWSEWDKFSEMVDDFVIRSKSLRVTAADSDDRKELKDAFFSAARSCKGCHKRFRKAKK